MLDKTLNIRGTLTSLATPLVMGILNITPDSFYAGSRKQTETAIEDPRHRIYEAYQQFLPSTAKGGRFKILCSGTLIMILFFRRYRMR